MSKDISFRITPLPTWGDKESFPDQARDYFGAEYAYLFEDGRWLVCEIHISSHSEWRELTEVLKEPELSEP